MDTENISSKNMNRRLVEKMLEMRAKAYLYNIKSEILVQAVLGINESRKLLHQTNHAFSSLFNRISHEIRTQLTSLVGTTSILLSKEGKEISPHLKEILDKINLVSKNILNITNKVNKFQQCEFIEVNEVKDLGFSQFYSDDLLKEVLFELSYLDKNNIIIPFEKIEQVKSGLLCGDHLLFKNVLFYIGSIIIDNLRDHESLKIFFHIAEERSITFHFEAKVTDPKRITILIDFLNYKMGHGFFFLHSLISLANGVTSLSHSDSGFSFQVRFLLKNQIQYVKKDYERFIRKVGKTRHGLKPLLMYIDDTELSLLLYKSLIENNSDIEVVTFSSGKNGLAYLETELPQIILLDIRMPDMDGYEVIGILKSHPVCKSIPVIAFTGDIAIETSYKDFGFAGFLPKPVGIDQMKKVFSDALML